MLSMIVSSSSQEGVSAESGIPAFRSVDRSGATTWGYSLSNLVRAYYLKESFQLFWDYKQEKRAADLLHKWMRSAMRSRLEPFKKFVRLDAWWKEISLSGS